MAVKKQEADDRLAALLASDAMQKFSKKHGESILLRGNDLKDHVKNVVRIPSGIFSLDYALAGGWPVGRVHVVYGEKSSGKTTTLLKTIANIQKLCANCWKYVNPDWTCPCGNYLKPTTAYLDVEGAVDYGWARTLGIECNDVLWSTPEFAEEALDLMDLTLRSGMIDVLILDSLAFLAPSAEIEKSVQKASVSIGALLVNKAMRKLVATQNALGNDTGRRPTVFLTNQIREKPGVMFGSPEVTPMGRAPGHIASVEAKFFRAQYKEMEAEDGTTRPLEVEIRFRIDKNKTGAPKTEGTFQVALVDTETSRLGDVNNLKVIMDMSERLGIMAQDDKKKWTCLGEQYNTKKAMRDRLAEDLRFYEALTTLLFEASLRKYG